MEENGCAPDVVTFNTLMNGFLKKNDAPKVVELLHKMDERNVMPDEHLLSIENEKYRECLDLLPSFSSEKSTKNDYGSKC